MSEVRAGASVPESLHALVVSTDRKTVEGLRRGLAASGYRLRASRDIPAGIRRFRRTAPDLLIIDARLLAHSIPEDVLGRFHVWQRHGDHYHPHGSSARSAAGTAAIDGIALDPENLTVRIGERLASLTPTEFAILVLLIRHRGKAVTRDEVLDAVSHEGTPDDRVVDRHICNLRHKIDLTPGSPSMIKTIRGIGYRVDPR